MVTEAAHWFGGAETRTAATASMACVLWHSCASVRRVIQMYAFNTGPSRLRAELSACKGTSKQRAMQSFEEPSLRSLSEASSGTKIGGQKSHFLRSRSLPRPALLSCPLVPFDAWLSATRCARSRACHTPSPRRLRTPQRTSRRNATVPTMPPWHVGGILSIRGPFVWLAVSWFPSFF